MNILREIAPTLDGSRHAAAWRLAQEIGVSLLHVVVDNTHNVLGTVTVHADEGPDAQLHVSASLSRHSGGPVYTPVRLYLGEAPMIDPPFQVTFD